MSIFANIGFADTADEKRAELDEVQRQMQRVAEIRENARRKAEIANDNLNETLGSLRALQAESAELQKQSEAMQKRIDENTAKLDAKKAELAERIRIYKKRLRDIYINGQINYLDVLLGAKDFSDFSSRMYLLQKIIRSDLSMLEQIKKDAEEIGQRQDELNAELRDIKITQNELEIKKAKVEELRKQRAGILYEAEEEKQSSEAEYERLLVISENIAAMLRNMENSGNLNQGPVAGGGFMWPCSGPITSPFGWRIHPVFGTSKFHSGIDIGVDYGTPILATNAGTVVYSGWLGGYGYCVMVDHGGGIVSLYGHNQSLAVSEGQYVNRGALLSYAGSTGYSTGPHLHFEIRVHGEVVDPIGYLP
ncbi:MAG: peptidoglycan DD-metalloendopeptidase family protein [Acidaminococcaceae bacterium]|nr:peptidoglycan DD-metalloendopeptidase family protein [Acidaminococcaceae bacterium]